MKSKFIGLCDASGKPIITGETCTVPFKDAGGSIIPVSAEVVNRVELQKMVSVYITSLKSRGFYYTVAPKEIQMRRTFDELKAMVKTEITGRHPPKYRIRVSVKSSINMAFSLTIDPCNPKFYFNHHYCRKGEETVFYVIGTGGDSIGLYISKQSARRFMRESAYAIAKKIKTWLTINGLSVKTTVEKVNY